jgi:hypothetical protein
MMAVASAGALAAASDAGTGTTPAAATPPAIAAPAPAQDSASAPSPPIVKVEDDSPVITTLERPNFTLKYPSNWKEDVTAKDYDANTNFTLVSPKISYIQFTLRPKSDDPAKIVADTVKKLDGPAITTLSKTKLDEWGGHKGQGYHLKGKIVGSFPGGIKVFVFSSPHFNVLIIEDYFSDELRDVQEDFDYISENFKMKN